MIGRIEELSNTFSEICRSIKMAENSYDPDYEKSYEKLLNFLIENVAYREFFGGKLASFVFQIRDVRKNGPGPLSIDAIAYCMHELRWQEVLDAAVSENDSYFSKRRDSTLLRLIDSFCDDWDEAEDYLRFRRDEV